MNDPTPLPLTLIAAVARNGTIGRDGTMPWRLPSDLAHFRAATMGKPVLMGRRTFESIGHPLPGRPTVVVSGKADFTPAGVTVVRTLADGLSQAGALGRAQGADTIMVIGGRTLYEAFISRAQTLLITEVDCAPEGDTRFPPIDPRHWFEVERTQAERRPDDDAAYVFVRYERRDPDHRSG